MEGSKKRFLKSCQFDPKNRRSRAFACAVFCGHFRKIAIFDPKNRQKLVGAKLGDFRVFETLTGLEFLGAHADPQKLLAIGLISAEPASRLSGLGAMASSFWRFLGLVS